jgi:CheY-like chemotaxis protein
MANRKKILIIDDEISIREMIKGYLFSKYEVIEAYDGLSGLGMAEAEKPDLIICDLLMPTVTGTEVIQEIKENPDTKNIPIVVITAAEDSIHEQLPIAKEDILRKPFGLDELQNIVEKKLNPFYI